MATLYYRDPATQQWVTLAGATGPSGPTGPTGPGGPTVVSFDAGNAAIISPLDGLVFVPGVDTSAMDTDFVNLTGDTMLGELLLPDQVTVPPPVVPTAVAAKGYVDQVITVSDADPVDLPARDGLIWNVVEAAPLAPPTNVLGTYVDATTNTVTWVDSVDAEATGYEVYYSLVSTTRTSASDTLVGTVGPGVGTLNHTKDSTAQGAGTVYYGVRAISPYGSSAIVETSVSSAPSVPPPAPPTFPFGIWDGATASTLTWVDAPVEYMATGYELFYNTTGAIVTETDTSLGIVLPGVQTLIYPKTTAWTAAGNTVFFAIRTVNATGKSELVQFTDNGTNWRERPLDWPPNTFVRPGDQEVWFLMHLHPNGGIYPVPLGGSGAFSFRLTTTLGGPFMFDRGKGTAIITYNSGDYVRSRYLFNDHPTAPVDSEGYRLVWCRAWVKDAGDTIETLGNAIDQGNWRNGTMGPVEILMGSGTFTHFTQAYNYGGLGMHVRHFDFLDETLALTSCDHMLYEFGSLKYVTGRLNTSNVQDFQYMFEWSTSYIDQEYTPLLEYPPLDTSSGTDFTNMFGSNKDLPVVTAMDLSNGTEFGGMFTNCLALTSILAYGATRTISVASTLLDAAALNTFFTNLGTANNGTLDGQQVVTITNCPGAAGCDRTIAEAKGWVVSG